MSTEKRKNLLLFAAVTLLAILLFAACGSKAATAADKIELGQKYLIELNYTEAIASFTEAIKLDPNNIQAYMGRAEAYLALGEYDKALEDYQFVCEKRRRCPTPVHFLISVRQKYMERRTSPKRQFRIMSFQRPF